ncbi:MAG TPA: hypothetical protein VEJ63_22360 [Planctomycetota bacterium]|nr:hypothetical protein [Planctomycetota bacterium]
MKFIAVSLLFLGMFTSMAGDAPKPAHLPPPKNVRLDKWRVLGMGGGGTMLKPTVSPHDPNVVVLKCDMTGAYITKDGGASWRMFNLRTGIGAFAFDPNNPKVIYAGNVGLWKSEDLGDTWSLIWPDPKKTKEFWRDDHGEYLLESEDGTYQNGSDEWIENLLVLPPRIFMDRNGTCYISLDTAKTWKSQALGDRDLATFTRMVNDSWPVLRPEGLRSTTATYELTMENVRFIYVFSIPDAKATPSCSYWLYPNLKWHDGKIEGGVISSVHGRTNGDLFQTLKIGDPLPSLPVIAVCGSKPDIAYVSFSNLKLGDGPDNLFNGIAKTEDGGKSWNIVHKESTKPSANLAGSWIEPRMRQGNPNLWFDAPRGLAVAPSDPNIVYATDCFRAYKSTDGGKTWATMNSFRVGEGRKAADHDRYVMPEYDIRSVDDQGNAKLERNYAARRDSSYDGAMTGTWQSRGLDVTNCYGVHWDPFDPQHMYLSQTDMGLFQSYDGGKSWQVSTTGVPDHLKNTTYWIECDPEVKGLMWGAFSYNHDLPRNKMWRGRDTDTYEGGVCVSMDGCLTWSVSSEGMPQTACTHILLDPTSPKDKRVLYACGFGKGVYKSSNNGKTWERKNKGIEESSPKAWRIVRDKDGTLYLIIAARTNKQAIPGPGDGCVYVSKDNAESWTRLPMPKGQNFPTGLAVDPKDPKRLYLTTWGAFSMEGDTGGVFLSTDGGQSWSHIFKLGPHCYDVTIDPKDPKTLYVCGFNSGAWRSTDAGATWSRIKGYNFKWGHRVIVDPVNAGMIYITTFGGGLWHGPAAGDPDAKEDILTPLPPKFPDPAVK